MHVEINSSCNYIFYRIEETSEYIILFNTLNNIDKYIMDEELTVHIYINNNSIGENNYDRRSLLRTSMTSTQQITTKINK